MNVPDVILLQELLNKAKGLIAKGLKMIETNELSKDQIKQKCDEIKELCDKFDKAVEQREEDLNKAMDIHECLDMVNSYFSFYFIMQRIKVISFEEGQSN